MTRLIEATLRVHDVERSRRFYERLGVPCGDIDVDEPGGEPHVHATWGEWTPGSDSFLMLNIYPAKSANAAVREADVGRTSLGFAVDDLDDLHRRLVEAGVDIVQAPTSRPWGRMATYRDPDGNTVSISQRPG